MKKQKFRYNPETLSYVAVEVTWKERILKTLLVLAPAIFFGFVFQFLFAAIFPSSSEKKLERENAFLQDQIEEMNEEITLMAAVVQDIEKRDNEIYRVVFNADRFPDEMRELGTGGADEFDHLKGYDVSEEVIANAKKIKELQKRIYAQSISFDEVIQLAREKEKMLACIPAIQPIANEDLTRMSSGYGWRIDPIYKTQKMHWGIDFTAETGTNVYATGSGTVKFIEEKLWGYGTSVVIDHGFGYCTRYAHLSGYTVKPGDKISRGQLIGYVGSTGKSTSPHLHYEVEKNGVKINPIHFFHSDVNSEDYERLLEMSTNANQTFD
ncbi:MAG: M23 family metallopeptidase [Crocinitomicaceae bacterium]|nr:M23 family metallopeptidase [Crocinitomicaceae bacterium]